MSRESVCGCNYYCYNITARVSKPSDVACTHKHSSFTMKTIPCPSESSEAELIKRVSKSPVSV